MTSALKSSSSVTRSGRATALYLLAGVTLGGLAAVACGDSDADDSLLGGSRGVAPTASSNTQGTDGGSDPNQNASSSGGPSAADAGTTGPTQTASFAEKAFRDLQADMLKTCGGAACHEGSTSAPTYLKGPDPYASLKAYDATQAGDKKLITTDSLSSRLFTKGAHTGPAMPMPDGTGNLGDKVKKWLDLEGAALASTHLPAVPAFTVTAGANTVDISKVGSGAPGATLTFTATIGTFLTLTDVKLVGGAAGGVHVVHPLFVRVPADPKARPLEDPADNGSNVDDTAGASKSIALGPGVFVLTGLTWQATDKLQIEFAKVEPGNVSGGGGDGGTGGGGCKNVAGFQSIAGVFMGQNITPNCTAACHKTGGSGDGAMDLNALVGGTPDYATACAQALTKVNLTNKAQSAIILHPTGQSGNHAGGTVNDVNGFTTKINQWLSGE